MTRTLAALVVLLLVAAARADTPDESWEIRGCVVDEQGQPVEDFVAATFWSSNGKWNEQDQKRAAEGGDLSLVWKEEGVVAPLPQFLATRLKNGDFTAKISSGPRVSIFATDSAQRRGGVISVERATADKPVRVTLLPLVRVTGKIYCHEAKKIPEWTNVVVHPTRDMENFLHFTYCGSLKGEFSFLLPPGKYDLGVYSEGPNAHMPKPHERKISDAPPDMPKRLAGIRVEVPPRIATLDLGELDVIPDDSDTLDYIARFYGKSPPALAITDARGVPKDVKLADLRGKWVLLDFWGLSCPPCIKESIPRLTTFYELHAADRDRFEILAICVGDDKTMEEFDVHAAPIIDKLWSGKPLPFPVLLDDDQKTFGNYHITSVPATRLIDPDGNLVKGGDEQMLAEMLKAPKPQPAESRAGK